MRQRTHYGSAGAPADKSAAPGVIVREGWWVRIVGRNRGPAWGVGGLLLGLALALAFVAGRGIRVAEQPPPEALAPEPSIAAQAYAAVRPSVVKVRGFGEVEHESETEPEIQVGTGVVIVDKGLILTNLHVVLGASRVTVVFADDLESEATVVGMRPEHDLAVLQAKTVPDDLVAATMRSTADLLPGDAVVAIGYPFGIGPSASAGVVSGLRREFRSPEGKRMLTNLIQFDAAANPGSSGGPLVTAGGEVVGIVTAILNPTEQRVFVGIGFAVPIENAAAAAGLSPF